MSLVIGKKNPVHFPKNPDRFQFDNEVAEIFQDMAERSIPQYEQVHDLQAHLIREDIFSNAPRNRPYKILDIGSSNGYLFTKIHEAMGIPTSSAIPGVEFYAIDPSEAMLQQIARNIPHAQVYLSTAQEVSTLGTEFDCVAMNYVMQFIPLVHRRMIMQEVCDSLIKDGMFFFAAKEEMHADVADVCKNLYMEFRYANGYTAEEVEAKTRALQSSMWTDSKRDTWQRLETTGFGRIMELTRWAMFSSLVCRKI